MVNGRCLRSRVGGWLVIDRSELGIVERASFMLYFGGLVSIEFLCAIGDLLLEDAMLTFDELYPKVFVEFNGKKELEV